MSWAMGRRYSGTGETWRSPPERKAATAGGLSPLLPFPGMQPRYLSPSSLSSESPAAASTVGWAASGGPLPPQGLQPEPSHEAAATASADEEQLQSMLSALRVALSKKEAALVSVVGQLADVQGRLQVCEADKAELAGQVRDLQLAAGSAVPERLPVACSVMPDGRLIAQVRQELGREASRAAELAAERDALRQDVALLHQQLVAAAQAEAKERERLCIEATQGRLLARARARQVEQLQEELQQASRACISTSSVASKQADAAQAEAASAQAATAEASARAAAAEAEVAQLRQQLESARVITMQDGARVAAVEADLAEARQQMDWQTLCITELKQTSSMGQLMRKYEGEVQRLRAQFDADRRNLQEQLAQAQQQEQQVAVSSTADETALTQPQFSLDSSAWKALFDEETSQQLAAELQDAWSQTEASNTSSSPQHLEADPALLEAARLEIERLQELNRALLGSQTKAQQALQGSLEQQQHAAAAHEREAALHRAEVTEHHVALDAAWRAEAGLREQLLSVEHQLAHKSGEVEALREANDKLELAVAAFKEELDAARHVPKQEEQLRAELLQAVAHTESLEAQVQQLKQVAASTAQEHVAQQGATDTAAQVAAAVAAAAERHEQQVLDLHTQLAEAHQQLQAARSELSTLQLDQTLRAQLFVDQATQAAGCQVGLAQSSMQTDMWPPFADTSIPLVVGQALTARQPPLQPLNARMQQLPSGGASTCPSSACSSSSMGCRSPTTLPVETTAMQLQLELARVRIPPLKSLVACSSLRAGSQAQQMPSRLGSTHGEHASSLGCGSLSGLAALRQAQGWGASPQGDGNSSTQLMQAEEEEGDSCFATPLAQTPTSLLKGGLAPFGNALWHAEDASQHQQHQQEQQRRVPVPALNLQLVKKHSSPEFPQLTVDGSEKSASAAYFDEKHVESGTWRMAGLLAAEKAGTDLVSEPYSRHIAIMTMKIVSNGMLPSFRPLTEQDVALLKTYLAGPYSSRIQQLEEEIAGLESKVHGMACPMERQTGLAPTGCWDLAADRQALQEDQSLQVVKCSTKLPGSDPPRFVIDMPRVGKFVVGLGERLAPTDIEEGMRVGVDPQRLRIQVPLPTKLDAAVTTMQVEERPDVTYSDVGGCDEQIKRLQEVVELPLLCPDRFVQLGLEPPRGALLCGPPGTGKTLAARAVANRTDATFICVIGSALVQRYVGEGARLVREIFSLARSKKAAIIFLDEVDAWGGTRGSDIDDNEVQRTMLEVMNQLDGFDARGNIKVLMATNRPDILDPALLRPGRVDRRIEFELPDLAGRAHIFRIHTHGMSLERGVRFELLARLCPNTTGADIRSVCTEAGMNAVRARRHAVTEDDFLKAVHKVVKEYQKFSSTPKYMSYR